MKNAIVKIAVLTALLAALIALLIVLTKKKDAIKAKSKKAVDKIRAKRKPAAADDAAVDETDCACGSGSESECDCGAADEALEEAVCEDACDCAPVCECEPVCTCEAETDTDTAEAE